MTSLADQWSSLVHDYSTAGIVGGGGGNSRHHVVSNPNITVHQGGGVSSASHPSSHYTDGAAPPPPSPNYVPGADEAVAGGGGGGNSTFLQKYGKWIVIGVACALLVAVIGIYVARYFRKRRADAAAEATAAGRSTADAAANQYLPGGDQRQLNDATLAPDLANETLRNLPPPPPRAPTQSTTSPLDQFAQDTRLPSNPPPNSGAPVSSADRVDINGDNSSPPHRGAYDKSLTERKRGHRDTLTERPTHGVTSEAPRNVSGENSLRAMHREYMNDSGTDIAENTRLPPPEQTTQGDRAPPTAAAEPTPVAAPVSAPVAAPVAAAAAAPVAAPKPPLAADPHFAPLE